MVNSISFDLFVLQEIDKDESTTQHQIPRSTTIDFIQSFRKHGDNDSFITPKRALKILDFCHLLVSRAPIQKEVNKKVVYILFILFSPFCLLGRGPISTQMVQYQPM